MDIYLIIVLSAIFLLIYNIALYPLLLIFFAKNKKFKIDQNPNFHPEISIVLSAYNEEDFIDECLKSIYDSDYPSDLIKVYVGSDGSDDNTYKIIKQFSERHKNLFPYNFKRSGKNKVLNELCKDVNTELIFFMDADIRLNKNTISHIVSIFSNEQIGAVICGMNSTELKNNDDAGTAGESFYQKYEEVLRKKETVFGTTVTSLGAFYGIRSETYKQLPNKSVLDDFLPIINSAICGKGIIYTDEFKVSEIRPKSLTNEFSRRVRISASGFATLWHIKNNIIKLLNLFGFFLLSHKILRWFWPLLLIVIIIFTPFIENIKTRNIFIIMEILLFLSAIIGYFLEKLEIRIKIFRFLMLFLTINLSFLLGFIKFLFGKDLSKWTSNR